MEFIRGGGGANGGVGTEGKPVHQLLHSLFPPSPHPGVFKLQLPPPWVQLQGGNAVISIQAPITVSNSRPADLTQAPVNVFKAYSQFPILHFEE